MQIYLEIAALHLFILKAYQSFKDQNLEIDGQEVFLISLWPTMWISFLGMCLGHSLKTILNKPTEQK